MRLMPRRVCIAAAAPTAPDDTPVTLTPRRPALLATTYLVTGRTPAGADTFPTACLGAAA